MGGTVGREILLLKKGRKSRGRGDRGEASGFLPRSKKRGEKSSYTPEDPEVEGQTF